MRKEWACAQHYHISMLDEVALGENGRRLVKRKHWHRCHNSIQWLKVKRKGQAFSRARKHPNSLHLGRFSLLGIKNTSNTSYSRIYASRMQAYHSVSPHEPPSCIYLYFFNTQHTYSLMMFCIIYVFTMTRDTKDTLIVSYCGKIYMSLSPFSMSLLPSASHKLPSCLSCKQALKLSHF